MRSELAVLVGAISFIFVTMVAYRFTSDGGRSDDKTGRGGSFVLGFWVRNWFYWFVKPIIRLAAGVGLTPFFFNALVVVFGVAGMVYFAGGRLALGGWMILLSGFADVMDGEVARQRGMASRAGAFVDSTLDRFSEFAVFIGLAAFFGAGFRVLVVLVALGGSLLVSYTRARGESLGVLCKGGLMQRAERILLLGIGAIVDPSLSGLLGRDAGFTLTVLLVAIALGTVGTAIYRTVWISRQLREG